MTCIPVNLAPACINLSGVRAGDSNQVTVTVTAGGTPVDLTGMTIESQVRAAATDASVALTAVVTVTDAANGIVTVRFPGDDVRDLLDGALKWDGVWDLQITDGSDDPVTVVAGTFQADMDVTRS